VRFSKALRYPQIMWIIVQLKKKSLLNQIVESNQDKAQTESDPTTGSMKHVLLFCIFVEEVTVTRPTP